MIERYDGDKLAKACQRQARYDRLVEQGWIGWLLFAVAIAFFALFAVAANAQSTRTVTLTWDAQPGTTTNVYRSTEPCPADTFTKITASPVNGNTFTDTVSPGRYCYYVTAVAGGLESTPSNKAQADAAPNAPANLRITVQVTVEVTP